MKLAWLATLVLAFTVAGAGLVPTPSYADDPPPGRPVPVQQVNEGPGFATHPLIIWDTGIKPLSAPAQPGSGALVSPIPGAITPFMLGRFLNLSGDGRGQTIAIVVAFHAPTMVADLDVFNKTFGLTPRCGAAPSLPPTNPDAFGGRRMPAMSQSCFDFSVVYARGTQPTVDSGWALEAALDVQWAHAVAPRAKIILVEASSNNFGDLFQAIDVARNISGVSVISNSWGALEFPAETILEPVLTKVLNVFGTGDDGNPGLYPAYSPNALAVGGTSLRLTPTGQRLSETAWSGSGGGVSQYFARPAFQSDVNPYPGRSIPDVSAVADPQTPVTIYFTLDYGGWYTVGGTSASAPIWAGIVAVIDQISMMPLTPQNFGARLYGARATGLYDVKAGSNGACGAVCNTNPGYDLVTGLGSANTYVDWFMRGAFQP